VSWRSRFGRFGGGCPSGDVTGDLAVDKGIPVCNGGVKGRRINEDANADAGGGSRSAETLFKGVGFCSVMTGGIGSGLGGDV